MKKLILLLAVCAAFLGTASAQRPTSAATQISQPTAVPGDLVCAVAGDTTIDTATVTGASVTGTGPFLVTYTMAATPTLYQIVGQKIGITGALPSAFNVASAAVVSATSTTVTISMASSPGTWTSGGTTFLACQNVSNATAGTKFLNTFTIPSGFWSTSTQLNVRTNPVYWTSASAPTLGWAVLIDSTLVWQAQNSTAMQSSLSTYQGSTSFLLQGVGPSQVMTNPISFILPASSAVLNPFTMMNNSAARTPATASGSVLALEVFYGAATAGNAVLLPRMSISY